MTKYRKRVLVGEVATRLRDLIRGICRTEEYIRHQEGIEPSDGGDNFQIAN